MRKFSVILTILAVLLMAAATVHPVLAGPVGGNSGILVKMNNLTTTYVRTWDWNIAKNGSLAELVLQVGQTAPVDYTVTVTGTAVDSGWTVSGQVVFQNTTTGPVVVNSVLVQIDGGITVTPTCPVTFPHTLPAGNLVACSFTSPLPDGSSRTATVVVDSATGTASASKAITFGAPASVSGQTVSVFDSMAGDLGTVTGDTNPTVKIFTYTKNIGPYGECGNYKAPNTAKLVGLHKTASWIVRVNVPCGGKLAITSHTVSTSFDRAWSWDITKSGSTQSLALALGASATVNYTVTVTGFPTDSGWAMGGAFSFTNLGGAPVNVSSVSADLTGGLHADPSCGISFPADIAPGQVVNCTYATSLPDGSARTSTASVNSALGTLTDDQSVTFGTPTTVSGQTINVTDSLVGSLGSVTGSTNPTVRTFTYSYQVGPYNTCGSYKVTNTAAIVETNQSAKWDVNVNVECAPSGGCTLTQGYWKTHSRLGPAPYDPAWRNIGSAEEQTTFFLSGMSWYSVFNTSPRGNVYYILAVQYMAAKLNVLNGAATTPAVSTAITAAETFFNTYTPTATLSSSVRNAAIANATLLDNYNNGRIGPGHCSP